MPPPSLRRRVLGLTFCPSARSVEGRGSATHRGMSHTVDSATAIRPTDLLRLGLRPPTIIRSGTTLPEFGPTHLRAPRSMGRKCRANTPAYIGIRWAVLGDPRIATDFVDNCGGIPARTSAGTALTWSTSTVNQRTSDTTAMCLESTRAILSFAPGTSAMNQGILGAGTTRGGMR